MTDIEFLVSFVVLLSGLLLANIANNMADALRARRDLPIGFTPWAINFYISAAVIHVLVLYSEGREIITFDMLTLIGLLAGFMPYILVSRLLYPEHKDRWESVEDYYIANRKLILRIMIIAPIITIFNFAYSYHEISIAEKIFGLTVSYAPVIVTLLLLMRTDKRKWHRAGFGFLIVHRIAMLIWLAVSAAQ